MTLCAYLSNTTVGRVFANNFNLPQRFGAGCVELHQMQNYKNFFLKKKKEGR